MFRLPEHWSAWEVTGRVGEGSYSVVYEAVRKDDPTIRCAVKLITIPQDESEYDDMLAEGFDTALSKSFFDEAVRDFTREVRLMEHFKGMQNIVSIEDYKVIPKEDGIGSYIYIRMELLNSLEKYLSDKVLSEREILQIGLDICTALEFCREKNIIHRDIKPANIFVNDRIGSHVFYKLGDFGIARNLEGKTMGMSAKGTPNYMAPEVAAGLPYDATADLYSLGLTLYWLLNGRRLPFFPQTQLYSPSAKREALGRRLAGEALPPPVNASPEAAEAILKACAYRKEDRYANATEMKRALEAVLRAGETAGEKPKESGESAESAETAETEASAPTPEKPKKRRAVVIGSVAAAVLILAGGGKMLLDRQGERAAGTETAPAAETPGTEETAEPEQSGLPEEPAAETAEPEQRKNEKKEIEESEKDVLPEETAEPEQPEETAAETAPAAETPGTEETAEPEQPEETATETAPPATKTPAPEVTEEPLPDWLRVGIPTDTPAPEETEEPLPDWLRVGITTETPASEETEEPAQDWLNGN